MKRVHVETWGCQMNVADSEKMLALLQRDEYVQADSAEHADLIILNTCHIREKARHKVVSRLGVLRELKAENPGLRIALTGCVAQAEGKKLLADIPEIDMVLGPGKIDALPKMVSDLEPRRKNEIDLSRRLNLGFLDSEEFRETQDATTELRLDQVSLDRNEISRFVNIQQGCNNYCTFCVVPHTRGREMSIRPESIVDQSRQMVAAGVKEITLLGQNVNSYGLDLVEKGELDASERGPFADLLSDVADIPDLQRLRFTTSNPHDLTRGVTELFAEKPKLGKYIHLPVQSGSDAILKTMKRKVTVAEYMERIAWLRESVPDMTISTDLIVGFPGESDEDFEATCRLVEEVGFSFIFAFKYSPRGNTPAKRFRNQIDENVKSARLARLNAIQDAITLRLAGAEVGKARDVLFLYESRKDPGVFYGRTPHFRLVRVKSDRDIVGLELPVSITSFNKTALAGELLH